MKKQTKILKYWKQELDQMEGEHEKKFKSLVYGQALKWHR